MARCGSFWLYISVLELTINGHDCCPDTALRQMRQFVDQQPAGNIFHTPEMIEVFERAKGQRPDWTERYWPG